MGGGAMFQQYTSSGIGLADPEVIPILQINDHFDANPIFGHVPTQNEVLKAMADLQKLMNGLVESKSNTNQPFPVQIRNELRTGQSPGYQRVLEAFHMLETEPSVKKMVLSISCDEAVWEAILKTEAVQNLQGSVSAEHRSILPCLAMNNGKLINLVCDDYIAAKEERGQKTMEEPEIANLLMRWIIDMTKVKILDLIEGFTRLICEVFQPNGKEKPTAELNDLLEDKLRNSFLMSVVLLMIVIATRNHGG